MYRTFLIFCLGCVIGASTIYTLYNTLWLTHHHISVLADGGQYIGEKDGTFFHGKGKLTWPDGSFYTGEFDQGTMNGEGTLQYADESRYQGTFSNGMAQGQGQLNAAGFTYSGTFHENLFHGYGEQTFNNGDTYKGNFIKDLFHGNGEYTTSDSETYKGIFVAGEFTGKGSHKTADGTEYQGEFENWLYQGHGTKTYEDGRVYQGLFYEGFLRGPGSYSDALGERYEGDFLFDLYHGSGKLFTQDGSRYEGEFENGYYHGTGTLVQASGDRYEGGFRYGQYHGNGTLTYVQALDGIKELKGVWEHGKFVSCDGECLIQPAKDIVEQVLYSQSELLENHFNSIKANNKDLIDLYFLGVAGYGSEAVFRREILYVKDYFDREYATNGKSLALINDRLTIDQYPLATLSSLKSALNALSKQMDYEQDILFVFLSSHGSQDHRFSIDMPGMELRDIGAESLAFSINALPVKWKVIVVSACYSGGFISQLENENTLVITAASHDKTSFGCSDRNVFTYFGEAFFKDALPQSESFVAAFQLAHELVTEREQNNDFTPSNPQIRKPQAILEQLKKWRTQREKVSPETGETLIKEG